MSREITHLISVGDSWFAYPDTPFTTNIMAVLKNLSSFTDSHANQVYEIVEHQAASGKTLQQMVEHEKGSQNIENIIKRRKTTNQLGNIKALLLAGGGNDFLNDFSSLLKTYKPGMSSQDAFDEEKMSLLIGKLKNHYQYFIDLGKKHECAVISLSYCYPIPRPNGFLDKIFKNKKYPDENIRKYICRLSIGKYFVPMLDSLCSKIGNQYLFYYVPSHKKVVEEYYRDEIHLNRKGCKKIALAIEDKLDEVF